MFLILLILFSNFQYLKEIILNQISTDGDGYLTVMHAGNLEEGEHLARVLGEQIDQKVVPITYVPPAIITHAGPGILAAGFFKKE